MSLSIAIRTSQLVMRKCINPSLRLSTWGYPLSLIQTCNQQPQFDNGINLFMHILSMSYNGQVATDDCNRQVLVYEWRTSSDIRFVKTSNRSLSCTRSLGLKDLYSESASESCWGMESRREAQRACKKAKMSYGVSQLTPHLYTGWLTWLELPSLVISLVNCWFSEV